MSGGKRVEDRKLGELVERVKRGESAGVIVWKLSRFSRSLLDAVETTTRITKAGGRLIADDFDSAQPTRKLLLGLMAGLAEEDLANGAKDGRWCGAAPLDRGASHKNAVWTPA